MTDQKPKGLSVPAFENLVDTSILMWLLLHDARVPKRAKTVYVIVAIFLVIYIVSPIDFIPTIPFGFAGMADDAVAASLLALATKVFMETVPADVLSKHTKTVTDRRTNRS